MPITIKTTGLIALRQAGFFVCDAWPVFFICPPQQRAVSAGEIFRLNFFTGKDLT
jgi:hypothetical protein